MKNMKKRMRVMGKALRMELREHKSSFIVYMTLRALVTLVMILQILNRNFENVFLCALTLVLLIMPSLIQINLKIELPTALEIIMLLFIFAAEILGEIQAYYGEDPHVGHGAAHPQWIPDGSHRVCPGGHPEPEQEDFLPVLPGVPGYRGVLLLHDHRCDLGIL